ncbi:receptor-activated ca2+-permeable cation channel [Moesziomyces antarcticus]|uniref:Receptor-activated ca2+-permeable cation channel n=2 Tax=Pseudozyma antarctica TaxID=84753 RepID=A0A081CJC1_PSEA2|nr:receptor-activated ca2+-permeable cation channel [Moesziomyces antarcticus]GAK66767.1 receptor-activated ca2+-permeable cation channel [Moesziomyces antarcticus]SPO47816.1 related to YVC1 - vacuolar cation channel [Moesziomyces antarcticus]
MSKAVSQRASANSLRGGRTQHKRHVSLRHLPDQPRPEDPIHPHLLDSTSPRSSAFSISSTEQHLGAASSSHPYSAGTLTLPRSGAHTRTSSTGRRTTEASAHEIDRLLESEGEDGVNLIKVVERQDVFHLIHLIRADLRKTIDTHLSWEELTSVDLNFSLVRPLAIKYSNFRSIAILYCLMLNRIYFQREATRDLAFQSVNNTRSALCELLAMKLLRTFSNDGLELVTSLTASFHPLAGATYAELKELRLSSSHVDFDDIVSHGLPPKQYSNTLELAIASSAKRFISTPLCQRCIDGIWNGKVVLSPIQASHAILNDSYKKRPLSIYDPTKAPLLNHLRLRVPSIRSKLEFVTFVVILVLYVAALAQKGSPTWTVQETLFSIWLFGFAVDELAQLQEHGVSYYLGSLYNLIDASFCIISFCWFGLRISALRHGLPGRSDLSFDCLALGAVVLCPRVASSLVQDNVVLLSLKAMLSDFAFFTVLAMVCFSGFAYAFYSLASEERWTFKAVLWLMLKVWFGSSYLGFDEAKSFSLEFGPPLMIIYTIMSNTLLLTVLISLLSNTFQVVAMNANEEAMFQFACKTMSGITTDAIFSYQPPLNLLAVAVVMPLSFVVSPRWLHKINVFLIRLTSFHILLFIHFCELNVFGQGISLTAEKGKSILSRLPIFSSGLDHSTADVIEAAFDFPMEQDKDEWPEAGDEAQSGDEADVEGEADETVDAAVKKAKHSDGERRLAVKANGSWEERAAAQLERRLTPQPDQEGRSIGEALAAPSQDPLPRSTTQTSFAGSTSSQRPREQGVSRSVQLLRRGHEPRGLGSLSSPLAKLFNRVLDPSELDDSSKTGPSRSRSRSGRAAQNHSRDSSPDGSRAEQKRRQRTTEFDAATAAAVAALSEEASPERIETSVGSDSLDAELRTIARRVQDMEARGKRMEDLLLQLLETANRTNHPQPPPSHDSNGPRAGQPTSRTTSQQPPPPRDSTEQRPGYWW